ncbi:Hypothetical_protein [Hexamita inflata]|uniref:Hypothetical_protein n=1 Tax=Hexamita inflata TaxID=28002 RepID=A0AA86VUE0_9EUKA|nr:Hypothetical protein HINF_LOCUS66273 [Hexamita inflata]
MHALTPTSQISAIILRTACTSCELLCLRVSQQHWLKLARLQHSSARSTPYFPIPFSLVQAVQQSLSAGVGRLHLQEVVCEKRLQYVVNTHLYNCHKMKLKQLYSESRSERLAFGMDGSGGGKQNPRVSAKLVPSRLRETGIIFHCFRLLRPLDFWKDSQTSRRLRERAGQQESTMINEYISAHSSAGSL